MTRVSKSMTSVGKSKRQKRGGVLAWRALWALPLILLSGCSSVAYYWQGFTGQLQILQAARPIDEWLASSDASAPPRQQLRTVRQMREFAISQLGLPRNSSYTRYADLQREYVVWNVVAAPPDSLQLHRWCFPVVGCVGYRGYFHEDAAREHAAQLRAQGLDVNVYGVPAYSTLGMTNWLGGDPVLNTFVGWPEGDVAGLLFHELAHQILYVRDDMAFNESFATTVERLGTPQWLEAEGSETLRKRWQHGLERKQQWRMLTQNVRAQLRDLYASWSSEHPRSTVAESPSPELSPELVHRKQQILAQFQQQYQQLRAQWLEQDEPFLTTEQRRRQYLHRLSQTDDWVAQANNASFGALSAYDEWVPAFTSLWQQAQRQSGGGASDSTTKGMPASTVLPSPAGWQRFYQEVRQLAKLPAAQRQKQLCAHFPALLRQPTACDADRPDNDSGPPE